jgi:predicted PurR-regulated permease PerM
MGSISSPAVWLFCGKRSLSIGGELVQGTIADGTGYNRRRNQLERHFSQEKDFHFSGQIRKLQYERFHLFFAVSEFPSIATRDNLVSKPKRYSFAFMVGLLVLSAMLKLGFLFLTMLFSFLLLEMLAFKGRKSLAIALFLLVITLVIWVLVTFTSQAVITLPSVAEQAIPSVVKWAEQHGRELPFTDWDSLRKMAMDAVIEQTGYFTNVAAFAQTGTRAAVQFIIGCVVAINIFLNARINLDRDEPDSLYGLCSAEVTARFQTFFGSFRTVMIAQLMISGINTVLTTLFLMAAQLPHHLVLIGVTFICGLLPVVGNLLSNVVIVAVAFTVSPEMALWALGFLVVIHKLEYFLNSKIVGDRIRNPVWLTLLGLVVGELTMGVTGMILAPVFLHYLKVEASRIRLPSADQTFT